MYDSRLFEACVSWFHVYDFGEVAAIEEVHVFDVSSTSSVTAVAQDLPTRQSGETKIGDFVFIGDAMLDPLRCRYVIGDNLAVLKSSLNVC